MTYKIYKMPAPGGVEGHARQLIQISRGTPPSSRSGRYWQYDVSQGEEVIIANEDLVDIANEDSVTLIDE